MNDEEWELVKAHFAYQVGDPDFVLRKRFDAVYALSVPVLKDFLETTTIGDPWNYVVGRILEYRPVSASIGPGDGGHLDEDGQNMKEL